jgi:hypothetical protein
MQPIVNVFAAVLFCTGVTLLIRPRSLPNFWFGPRIFSAPKWDALHPSLVGRLRDAFERRRELIPAWPGYVCGALQIVVAAVAVPAHFSLAQLFAAFAAVYAPVLSIALIACAPRTARRVALVRPRKVVEGPAWVLSFLSTVAIAVIGFAVASKDSITIAVAAVVCGVSALVLTTAPTVIIGQDLAVEQYVDKLVRTVQGVSLNLLATVSAVALLSSRTVPDWTHAAVFIAYGVSWLAFYFTYRLPNDRERLEMVQ